VVIYVSLVFNTRGTLPSKSMVLQLTNSLLIGMKLKINNRVLTERQLNDLVSSVNVTYNGKFAFLCCALIINEEVKFYQPHITIIVKNLLLSELWI